MKNSFSKTSFIRDTSKETNKETKKETPNQTNNKDEINWGGKNFKFQVKFGPPSGGGGGSSGGGGSTPNAPFGMNNNSFIGFVAGILVVAAFAYYEGRYNEIKMRDFIADYLLKNRVDRVEVVNKRWARVVLDKSQNEPVSDQK